MVYKLNLFIASSQVWRLPYAVSYMKHFIINSLCSRLQLPGIQKSLTVVLQLIKGCLTMPNPYLYFFNGFIRKCVQHLWFPGMCEWNLIVSGSSSQLSGSPILCLLIIECTLLCLYPMTTSFCFRRPHNLCPVWVLTLVGRWQNKTNKVLNVLIYLTFCMHK